MRTLGFRSHVLLAVAAAVGVIAALGEPWYARAPQAVPASDESFGTLSGPVEGLSAGIGRWIGETSGTSGWDALGTWGTVLAALAALTALGALGCLVDSLQGLAREALRYAALATFAIAVWKLIDTPGPNQVMEPRFGAFVATAAALIAAMSGSAVAAAPLKRRRAPAFVSS
jgi:hypothetical protein